MMDFDDFYAFMSDWAERFQSGYTTEHAIVMDAMDGTIYDRHPFHSWIGPMHMITRYQAVSTDHGPTRNIIPFPRWAIELNIRLERWNGMRLTRPDIKTIGIAPHIVLEELNSMKGDGKWTNRNS